MTMPEREGARIDFLKMMDQFPLSSTALLFRYRYKGNIKSQQFRPDDHAVQRNAEQKIERYIQYIQT